MGKRSEQEVQRDREETVRWVMSGPKGRAFMWWLLGETGLYESVFRQPPMVAPEERIVFNGARRDLGLMLQSELRRICPTQFDTMGLEARVQKALETEPAKPVRKSEETDE